MMRRASGRNRRILQVQGIQDVLPPIGNPLDIPGCVLWLRADLGVTVVQGPVVATGTTPPTVTMTGTPATSTNSLEIDITAPGARGTAVFSWKLNGVVQQTLQLTAATFVLGTTGITANFSAGTYTNDNVYKSVVTVSSWADSSGAGIATPVTQSNALLRPVFVASDVRYNLRPTLSFAATGQYLASAAWSTPLAQPNTWILVGDITGIAFFMDGINGTNRNAALLNSTIDMYAGAFLTATPATPGSPHVWAFNFAPASLSKLYQDNSQSPLATGDAGAQTLTGLTLGAAQDGSTTLQGTVARVLCYSVPPTSAQLKAIFAGLGGTYGIATS